MEKDISRRVWCPAGVRGLRYIWEDVARLSRSHCRLCDCFVMGVEDLEMDSTWRRSRDTNGNRSCPGPALVPKIAFEISLLFSCLVSLLQRLFFPGELSSMPQPRPDRRTDGMASEEGSERFDGRKMPKKKNHVEKKGMNESAHAEKMIQRGKKEKGRRGGGRSSRGRRDGK